MLRLNLVNLPPTHYIGVWNSSTNLHFSLHSFILGLESLNYYSADPDESEADSTRCSSERCSSCRSCCCEACSLALASRYSSLRCCRHLSGLFRSGLAGSLSACYRMKKSHLLHEANCQWAFPGRSQIENQMAQEPRSAGCSSRQVGRIWHNWDSNPSMQISFAELTIVFKFAEFLYFAVLLVSNWPFYFRINLSYHLFRDASYTRVVLRKQSLALTSYPLFVVWENFRTSREDLLGSINQTRLQSFAAFDHLSNLYPNITGLNWVDSFIILDPSCRWCYFRIVDASWGRAIGDYPSQSSFHFGCFTAEVEGLKSAVD